jgi:hypothetical protein
MMPRSQIAALAVLLVGLAVVLALVANTGVSTGVFSTATPTATASPSPTPLPEASANNWTSSTPGQLTYSADPNINAQIVYQTAPSLDQLVGLTGLSAPAADDPYPLVSLLGEIRDELTSQANDSQLTLAPDAFTGPVINFIQGTPVAEMRLQVGSQTTGTGQDFPGLDLVQMFVQHPDSDQITFVQYVVRGEPNPAVYADFRAWLNDHIADILAQQAPTPTPTPTAAPEATESATPEAGAPQEVTPEATEEVIPEVTEEVVVTPEATQETVATPEPTAESSSGN